MTGIISYGLENKTLIRLKMMSASQLMVIFTGGICIRNIR